MPEVTSPDLLPLVGKITTAYVANNRLAAAELPGLVSAVHDALATLGQPIASEPAPAEQPKGAVGIRKSLADPNFIVSMIDGKPYRTLKRHLGKHGLDPAGYRERYGLPATYPMVAQAYSEARCEIAYARGLGRKAGRKVTEAAVAIEAKVEAAVKPCRRLKIKTAA